MSTDTARCVLYLLAGLFGGAVGSIAGFGIGSLLTPAIAAAADTKVAVAAVSIPHAIGTAIRFWRFRRDVDWPLVRSFGITSAAGGITGALLNTWVSSRPLEIVFGALLILAGASQVTGFADRWRLRGALAWLGGALSGFFGGLVGNQGGIRTAAMLGFEVNKRQFVATATAIALFVDGARMPVYFFTHGEELRQMAAAIAVSSGGAVAGTIAGQRALSRIPEPIFRRVVAVLLVALGVALLGTSISV